jgi:hypothetical protein
LLDEEEEDEVFSERYAESGDIRFYLFDFKLRKIRYTIPIAFFASLRPRMGTNTAASLSQITDKPNVAWYQMQRP